MPSCQSDRDVLEALESTSDIKPSVFRDSNLSETTKIWSISVDLAWNFWHCVRLRISGLESTEWCESNKRYINLWLIQPSNKIATISRSWPLYTMACSGHSCCSNDYDSKLFCWSLPWVLAKPGCWRNGTESSAGRSFLAIGKQPSDHITFMLHQTNSYHHRHPTWWHHLLKHSMPAFLEDTKLATDASLQVLFVLSWMKGPSMANSLWLLYKHESGLC